MNDDATGGEQATITCTTCWTEQPSAEFRRRYAGSEKRHRECRQCYNSASRKRCAAKRQKLVREVAKQVNARRMDYRAVIVLVNKMRERFGGWDQFASEWCDTFQTARKAKKHDLVVRIWRAMFSIISACDRAVAADAIPVGELTDDDLARQVTDEVEKLVRRQPELILGRPQNLTAGE